MPSRSQRHLREFQGADSSDQAAPGVTAVRAPTSISTTVATGAGALTVTLTDRYGNLVPAAWVTATSATPATATVSPASTVTGADGVATFTVTPVAIGGPINITFTSSTDATIAAVPVTVTA